MVNTQELKGALIELMSQFGNTREALTYMKRYGDIEAHKFAIIKVGGGVLEDELDDLVSAISFMRHMGLVPIIVHGAGPQLDRAITKAGVPVNKIEGKRVTSPDIMKIVRHVMYEANHTLQDALEARGIRARGFQHGIFECDYLDEEKFGLVGKIEKVNLEALISAVKSGAVPVIPPLGESLTGQMLNINADTATRSLARAIQPMKVVFVTPSGGLWDAEGNIITAVNLVTDYDHLMTQDWVQGGMRLKLQEIKELLGDLPDSASVSITSTKKLTRELFTYKGAGTFIRQGESMLTDTAINPDMQAQAKSLLEACFKQTLEDGYFNRGDIIDYIWSSSGRVLAVIAKGVAGVPYLDKFAVTPEAQGEGLGASLWAEITKRHPKLYWRSRTNNPINNWYISKADAMVRAKDSGWLFLSYGEEDSEVLGQCQNDALNKPTNWVDET